MADQEITMSFTEHLRELRKRLIISAVALVAGFGVAYTFSQQLYEILTGPLIPALPEGYDFLVFTGVVEPFFIYIKVGILGGAVLSCPVVLYELWAFVAPGLYREERRWFVAIVLVSIILFLSGALFAYFVVFPFAFKYLLSYSSSELKPVLSMGLYFSLVTRLLLGFGAVFQFPLGIIVLARMGLVTAGQLASWWRYAIIGILVVSAVLTPPDVFSQMLMAGPLALLYVVGIIGAGIFGKKKEAAEEAEEAETGPEDKDRE